MFLAVDYAMDYAKLKPDYIDHCLKPVNAEMTCIEPDNADHYSAPINAKYAPLVSGQCKCVL